MKKAKSTSAVLAVSILFILMALASTPPRHTSSYYKPKPLPCIKHGPLNYSPVLVKINLSGNYTMKDLSEAQRTRPFYIIDALNGLTANKYKLADGVTPNLTLNITVTTDNYGHYGATVNGYVYDGEFYSPFNTDYITIEKLYDDISSTVNVFITRGWCRNCPGPCSIP